jgi:microcystin-dependent protein
VSEPFLSEIRIVSFSFAPKGWAKCDGQLLPINQNQALFSLLGTTFGGNGQTTFALPDLRGRMPMHFGASFVLGQGGGSTAHTLTAAEMPQHAHLQPATTANAAADVDPVAGIPATAATKPYRTPTADTMYLDGAPTGARGGSQPHANEQPYLVLNFVIALQGIYPSRD